VTLLVWVALTIIDGAREVRAEWYVGGYGGISAPSSLKDVSMPLLGQRLAQQRFPQANDPLDANGRGTLTQLFKTSDLSLNNSPIFGGKVGYFFNDYELPWLGVELEAFTAKPMIKTQTVRTTQEITYQPNTPAPAAQCLPPVPIPNCPGFVQSQSSLTLQESPLRVVTVALNLITRYPGKFFQPYVGAGAGAFYFSSSSGSIQGSQWVPGVNLLVGLKILATEEFGLFIEGKYNRATVTNLDPTFGLSGEYSVFNFLGGVAYHF
jgi:opacity protein-like surface antigen